LKLQLKRQVVNPLACITHLKHDIVAVVQAPNDETIASVLYSTGSLGNVRTETLRAFSTSEAAKVIEKILN
jgi:uncharacterized protein with GYD domain